MPSAPRSHRSADRVRDRHQRGWSSATAQQGRSASFWPSAEEWLAAAHSPSSDGYGCLWQMGRSCADN